MKRVCLFNFPPIENFHGYHIETFDPLAYFPRKDHWAFSDLIIWGLNGYDKRRAITAGASGVDRLYRERNPFYMRMISDFIDRFREFDFVIMGFYNFIHPEVLVRDLKKPIKILGFIDDPISTYTRGIPYLWAFDGAFYISPGYIDDILFDDAIHKWCDKPAVWWPLVPYSFNRPKKIEDSFFRKRSVDIVYVGKPCESKVNRLIKLKRHFDVKFQVYGRWPFGGYSGLIRALLGKPIYPHRVLPISDQDRTSLYWRTKIGFNMHVSDSPFETGNMRMYEIPAHGMLMVCDKSSSSAHEIVFRPNIEAVYYDTLDEAIGLIEYYLHNEEERVCIAKNGFARYWNDYEWERNLLNFLQWCETIRCSDM